VFVLTGDGVIWPVLFNILQHTRHQRITPLLVMVVCDPHSIAPQPRAPTRSLSLFSAVPQFANSCASLKWEKQKIRETEFCAVQIELDI